MELTEFSAKRLYPWTEGVLQFDVQEAFRSESQVPMLNVVQLPADDEKCAGQCDGDRKLNHREDPSESVAGARQQHKLARTTSSTKTKSRVCPPSP